jgi:hypothetical protein
VFVGHLSTTAGKPEMNIGRLAGKAKQIIDRRGGMDALKKDAEELKGIAQGGGTLSDKAKAAAEALKDPGARGGEPPVASPPPTSPPPRNPEG